MESIDAFGAETWDTQHIQFYLWCIGNQFIIKSNMPSLSRLFDTFD